MPPARKVSLLSDHSLNFNIDPPPSPLPHPKNFWEGVKKYEKSDYSISAEAEIPMPVDFIYQSKTFDSFFLVHT